MMLNDKRIESLGVIAEGFVNQEGKKIAGQISSGVTSYGYDMRLGYKFRVFKPYPCTIIDPKNFDERMLENVDLTPKYCRYSYSPWSGTKGFVSCDYCTGKVKENEVRTDCVCKGQTQPDDHLLIPPHSFVLAESMETFSVPRFCLGVVLGKSTYARCFSANTKIRLVDGTCPNFGELTSRWEKGERGFYGYGFDKELGYVVQELVAPRKVGTELIVEVELDNGEIIECTADHEFVLRNQQKVRADNLKAGDSLLPLYLHDSHGYESVYNPISREWRNTHLLVDDLLTRKGLLPLNDGSLHVHHLDKNIRNNHPSNLHRLTASEHGLLHSQERDMSGLSKDYWADEDNKKKHLEILHSESSKGKALESRMKFNQTEQGKIVNSKRAKKAWETRGEEGKKKQASVMRELLLRKDITEQSLVRALLEAGTLRGAARLLKCGRCVFKRFPDVIAKFKEGKLNNNHKVVAVRPTGKMQGVYCLTAPDTGNFALASGVIVSNCGLIVNCTPMEPEWRGVLTIELSNTTPLPLKIYPGEGIAQVFFLEAQAECAISYADKKGKYQNQVGVTTPTVPQEQQP